MRDFPGLIDQPSQPLADHSRNTSGHTGRSPVLIVGAGLSGLLAAQQLAARGRNVIVFDKAAGVGGRLATRRIPGSGGRTARLDHGAQFFTVRSPEFAELVERWRQDGVVREWCRGFRGTGDGYPRYCANDGMNSLAKYLAADLQIIASTKVHAVGGHERELSVLADDGRRWASDTVVLTPPVPQSLALCENGWLPLDPETDDALRAISYAPCLALLVTIEGSGAVPSPGGLQLTAPEDAVFSFVADNRAKGISDVGALTFHSNDAVSFDYFDRDEAEAKSFLLAHARPYLGDAAIVSAELKRWRYARPVIGSPRPCLVAQPIDGTRLIFAGDAFGDAKVEGAALSGLAVADAVLLSD